MEKPDSREINESASATGQPDVAQHARNEAASRAHELPADRSNAASRETTQTQFGNPTILGDGEKGVGTKPEPHATEGPKAGDTPAPRPSTDSSSKPMDAADVAMMRAKTVDHANIVFQRFCDQPKSPYHDYQETKFANGLADFRGKMDKQLSTPDLSPAYVEKLKNLHDYLGQFRPDESKKPSSDEANRIMDMMSKM